MEKQNKQQKLQKPQKPHYVKICPKCKSINVGISHQGFLSGLVALGMPTVYRCEDCGFSNRFFPEVDFNEIKEIKAKKYKTGKS